MRGEMGVNIDLAARAAVATRSGLGSGVVADASCRMAAAGLRGRCALSGRFGGRSNIYLVLLDDSDSRDHPYGVYVGMSHYAPAVRFDQHKAGIRAAGSVLKRGLEVLTGPTLHLQHIRRDQAARIEAQLAQALAEAGLLVQGGH
jgi:hypothetical protein